MPLFNRYKMKKSEKLKTQQSEMAAMNKEALGSTPDTIHAWKHPDGAKIVMQKGRKVYSFIKKPNDPTRYDQYVNERQY